MNGKTERKLTADETRAYPHSTWEFSIPGLKSDCKMVSAIYNNELHVIGGDPDTRDWYRGHYIKHMKFPLDKLVTKGQTDWNDAPIKDEKNWKKVNFSKTEIYASSPYNKKEEVTASDNTSLVANTTALWLFRVWSDGGNTSLLANKYQSMDDSNSNDTDSSKETWGEDIKLYEPNSNGSAENQIQNIGAVSACAFGDNQITVACCGIEKGEYGSPNEFVLLYHFDLDDIKTDDKTGKTKWFAKSHRKINIKNEAKFYLGDKLQGSADLYSGIRMDIDWIYTMKPDPNNEKKGIPQFYLAMLFTPSIPWNESYSYAGFLPLTLDTKDDQNSKLADNPWGTGNLDFYNQGDGVESSIKRDPSGRLQRFSRYGGDRDLTFQSIYFSTALPPTLSNSFGNQPEPYPYFNVSDNKTRPSNLFYTFAAGKKKTTTTGKDKDGNKVTLKPNPLKPEKDPIEYPVLEFIFYGENKCQLHDYGRIVIAQDTQYLKQKEGQKKAIIGGYFDSAIPFPVQNFKGQDLSNNEQEIGEFIYRLTREDEKEVGLETGWSVGVEADFKTTKGIGPNFKMSVEGSYGSEKRETISSEIERGIGVTALVKNYDDLTKPHAEEGSGLVNLVKTQFNIMGYQFYDASGKLVNDALSGDKSHSLKMGAILTRMIPADVTEMAFEPYMVEPNDLRSFTPEAINKKMKSLGYSGDHYFDEIIRPNSMPLSGLPYLPLTWTHAGGSKIKVATTKSDFTEQTWDLDTSLYVGVGGGEEISFFGLGEGFEFSAMVGGSYSRKREVGETKSSGWGVEISEKWGPITPKNPEAIKDAVKSYSFRMYFMPVPTKDSNLHPTYWTDEFIKYLQPHPTNDITKEMVDTSSGSWRISFVVDNITCYDPNSEYNYDYTDDTEITSVYA